MYDSTNDTLAHIQRVRNLLCEVTNNLSERGANHDQSKLEEPEKSVFDRVTPRLKELVYGTPEYQAQLEEMGVALEHHYQVNDHHPQHFKGEHPIMQMNLLNITEMLCDWKAAGERMTNGDIYRSIEQNQQRFGYSDELKAILVNTARALGWES